MQELNLKLFQFLKENKKMKKIINFLILGLILISPNVNLKAQDVAGLIWVKADGFGKKQQHAIEDAQYRAFEIMMFSGIPGTALNVPLIENESETKSKYKSYFNELKEGRFKDFITNSNVISAFVKVKRKDKGAKNITVQTEINYKALRIDLEQNQVIRKFGL
jgi:hypothetical protein